MRTPEQELKKNLWHSSGKKNILIFSILVLGLFSALFLRFYVIEPYSINDASMFPELSEKKRIWVCKLPLCTQNLSRGQMVSAERVNGDLMLRKLLGLPGDTIRLSADSYVSVDSLSFHWEGENTFIVPRQIYVPQRGDTLYFEKLSDVELDYAFKLFQQQNPQEHFQIQIRLYQGEKEISLEKAGNAQIAGRPVNMKELKGLPWQELFLIELQLQKMEPGSRKFHFVRKIIAADSSEIQFFVVNENAFYLVCQKANFCLDSRELGYFPESRIIGKVIR